MYVQEVDEQYCISFVFKGDWKAKLRGQGQIIAPDGGSLTKVTVESDDINEDGEEKVVGTFSGLTIGGDYTLEVKEDAVLGAPAAPSCVVLRARAASPTRWAVPTVCLLPRAAKAPRKVFVAASGGMSGRQDNFNASLSVGMGEDSSSCSCLFGCAPRPSRHTKAALHRCCCDTPCQEPLRLVVQLQGLAQPQRSRQKERLERLQLSRPGRSMYIGAVIYYLLWGLRLGCVSGACLLCAMHGVRAFG